MLSHQERKGITKQRRVILDYKEGIEIQEELGRYYEDYYEEPNEDLVEPFLNNRL
jgi:hypothetical protein